MSEEELDKKLKEAVKNGEIPFSKIVEASQGASA